MAVMPYPITDPSYVDSTVQEVTAMKVSTTMRALKLRMDLCTSTRARLPKR